jgi:predicted phosphodiesterase
MRSDFCIIEHEFPRRDIKIYPLSDLHVGAQEFNENAWKALKKQILSGPDNYLIIAGDLLNNGTKNSVTNCFDETMRPREQKKWLAEQLEPLKDRILCGTGGNHEARNRDVDDDPLYDVFCKLGIEDRYRQRAAFLCLRFGDKDGAGDRNPTYSMLVMHGKGGLAKLEKFSLVFDGLDILVTGHTHKGNINKPRKIVIDLRNRKISEKPFLNVVATAWLDYGGYALGGQYLPGGINPQVITLCGKKKEMTATM